METVIPPDSSAFGRSNVKALNTEDEKTIGPKSWIVVCVMALLCFFIITVAIFILSHQSLRLDEAQSLWQSARSPAGILKIIAQDVHVPLFGLMLHFWMLVFGNGVAVARVMSLALFIAAVPAVYLLASLAFNKKIGLFSAVLIALSPFLNWYGSEIRMYSLLTLLTVINQYFFLAWFRFQQNTNHKPFSQTGIWTGYGISALLGIYTHYFFWLILLTQGVFYLIFSKQFPKHTFRNLSITATGLAVSISPWLYYVKRLNMISNSEPLLIKPTTVDLFNAFSQFIFGFHDDHVNTLIVSLWPLAVLFIFLGVRKHAKISPQTVYFFMSAFLPIAVTFIVSIFYRPVFLTRYLIFTTPSLFIFFAWFFDTYPKKTSTLLKSILVIAMIATFVLQIKDVGTPVKENYEQASWYIGTRASAQDIIVLSAPFTVYPFEYYYKGPSSIQTLPLWERFKPGPIPPFIEDEFPPQVESLAKTHQNIWLLLSYDQGYEQKLKYYFDSHYKKIDEQHFSSGLYLYVYETRQKEKFMTAQ